MFRSSSCSNSIDEIIVIKLLQLTPPFLLLLSFIFILQLFFLKDKKLECLDRCISRISYQCPPLLGSAIKLCMEGLRLVPLCIPIGSSSSAPHLTLCCPLQHLSLCGSVINTSFSLPACVDPVLSLHPSEDPVFVRDPLKVTGGRSQLELGQQILQLLRLSAPHDSCSSSSSPQTAANFRRPVSVGVQTPPH